MELVDYFLTHFKVGPQLGLNGAVRACNKELINYLETKGSINYGEGKKKKLKN
jgi:hypothetical protein